MKCEELIVSALALKVTIVIYPINLIDNVTMEVLWVAHSKHCLVEIMKDI